MRKLTLSLAAAALALTGGTAALAQGDAPAKRGPDANGDGVLTQAEMSAGAAKMFARMDANGDGVIDAADRAARKAERFARLDADGNGEVTQAEMDAHRAMREAKREERREARFARLDIDNSGGVSAEEMAAAREKWGERGHGERMGHHGKRGGERMGHGGKRGGMMLKLADTNGDKSVTRAEFDTAIAKHFALIDANKDGQVTQEERRAAREKLREMRAARQQS